jgi:para-nitrobenzyl esterase
MIAAGVGDGRHAGRSCHERRMNVLSGARSRADVSRERFGIMSESTFQSDRRRFLIGSLAASGLVLLNRQVAFAAGPIAETAYGKIQGYDDGPIKVFKGVPYGADTGGANRWLPAKPPQAWSGVREATTQGAMCPQRFGAPMTEETAMLQNGPYSEDCLNLNVSTPAVGANSGRRPVMVWFHGGGFSGGSGGATSYDARNLCEKHDVVLVTVTHRLNIFGFLYLPELYGAQYADSGNAGILDCVAALQWVRANIANFGGDPGNVTIFGQSGGGGKVSALMGMTPAKGLFHRAIVESASFLRGGEKAQATNAAKKVVDALQVKSLKDLQAVPADKLVEVMASTRFGARPVVDGRALPADPFEPTASPLSASVPLMTGFTRNEANFTPKPEIEPIDDARLHELVKGVFPKIADNDLERVVSVFRAKNPGEPNNIIYQLIASQNTGWSITHEAERKAEQKGAPAYVYYFTHTVAARGGKLGAPHTAEIPYAFDSLAHAEPLIGKVTPKEQALADKLSLTWTTFAKTGNPSNRLIPTWKPYNLQERPTMVLDDEPKLVNDPLHETRMVVAEMREKYLSNT